MPYCIANGGVKQLAGREFSWNPSIYADADMGWEPDNLEVAIVLDSWNMSDTDTGAGGLPSSHGLTTGTYDVFWDGGSRHGMTGTVGVDSIDLDGGAGDDLPEDDTEVTICKQQTMICAFVGNNLNVIAIKVTERCLIRFVCSDASIVYFDIAQDEGVLWHERNKLTNPFAEKTVASATISSVSTTDGATPLQMAIGHNSTP
jgi:hypothetical protein